ncbi:MAG: DUF1559 domain-containing protein [Armatimonadota bacterium]|nr:DUF1559 domain-containing protein [Armatimonadota bacterium]
MESQPERRKGLSGGLIALIACGGCVVLLLLLSIPAAILFPVFAKARESARKAGCQSNLKELSLAVNMYAQDHDLRFPCAVKGGNDEEFEITSGAPGNSGRATTWVRATDKYRRSSPDILRCPSDPAAGGVHNSYYYKHAVNRAGQAGLVEADFNWPAEQIVLYERKSFHWGRGPIMDGASVNAAFMDTHVSTVRMIDVAPDKEPRYFNFLDTSNPKAAKVKKPYWDPRYCFDKHQ